MDKWTWEEAVQWLCQQPDKKALIQACYYDDPLIEAAKRFADSEEWLAVQAFLPNSPNQALDLGAGRGISSYALARNGWEVTALEPDSSSLVGAGAIRTLAMESGLPIRVMEEYAETLPFGDASFDLVYGRQVLHHARDLALLCREVGRVLKPGGRFIATREHVISKQEDLDIFLANHPLHKFYGGENAYLFSEYVSGISNSGLRIQKALGPFDSIINYFPMSHQEWQAKCRAPLSRFVGMWAAGLLTSERYFAGRWMLNRLSNWLSNRDHRPGRLYSFVAEKID